MRRIGLVLALAFLSLSTTSCGSKKGPVFADMVWEVRCPNDPTFTGCAAPAPARDVNNVDGEAGHQISCSVTAAGSLKDLSFRVYHGTDYGIQVDGASFDPSSGNLSGAGCTMRVLEGGNMYQGACGANTPTAAQPCQITGIHIMDAMDGPEISGSIFCHEISAPVDPMALKRDVTAGGTGIDVLTQPFAFRLVNCSGL